MTTLFAVHPNADGLVRLSGRIGNYRGTRTRASFVFTQSDQSKLGVIAVAAGLAGLAGQAISTAASASDLEEEADHVEFDLAGQQVKGWVWRSPFQTGDVVEVVAELQGAHFEVIGIARPSDRVIALYPHCSRGSKSHRKNSLAMWLFIASLFVFSVEILGMLQGGWAPDEAPYRIGMVVCSFFFFGVMTHSLTRKWLPFVRLAEKVFRALDLPDPANIDLVKSSKRSRTPQDPPEFGTFYFRY